MKIDDSKRPAGAHTGIVSRGALRASLQALLAAAVVMAVLVSARSPAWAQDASAATCSFIEIKATNGPGGIDPKLSKLQGKLKKPPFSAWKTFSLLAQQDRRLTKDQAASVPLALGGKLSARLREHSKAAGKKDRVSLSLTLDDKQGKRALDSTVNVDAGDYVVIGYALPDGSGHLVALRCTP